MRQHRISKLFHKVHSVICIKTLRDTNFLFRIDSQMSARIERRLMNAPFLN